MLTRIEHNHLYWTCLLLDDDGEVLSCGQERRAHLDEVRYQYRDAPQPKGRAVLDVRGQPQPQQGHSAVMALPRCACGVQQFLKADYSIKEAWKCVVEVEMGTARLMVMLPQHARNLVAHWLLYERGQAEHAPVLPMPATELVEAGLAQGLTVDAVWALWFGYQAVQARATQVGKGMLPEGQIERLLLATTADG